MRHGTFDMLLYFEALQGNRIAIKLLGYGGDGDTGRPIDPMAKAMLHQEALIMCQLYHPCVARVYGIVDEEERLVRVCCGTWNEIYAGMLLRSAIDGRTLLGIVVLARKGSR
jgi:hypothetical protein